MILGKIVDQKRERLEARKASLPLSFIKDAVTPPERDFLAALQSHHCSLIAEFKRSSPSKGRMGSSLDCEQAVSLYNKYAQAISILTEEDFFQGSLEDLALAARTSRIPILRKDFLLEPYEIYESRHYGADAVLLISDILTKDDMAALYELTRSLSMHALIELHHEESLEKVLPLAPPIIGINNRNLDDLTIERETTKRLSRLIPPGTLLVSESGFTEPIHLIEMKPYVGAFLIGTAFMSAAHPEATLAEFAATLSREGDGSA